MMFPILLQSQDNVSVLPRSAQATVPAGLSKALILSYPVTPTHHLGW